MTEEGNKSGREDGDEEKGDEEVEEGEKKSRGMD